MSDTTPPDVPVQPARRSLLERVSIVWVIPVIALVIALAVAWETYASRGPVISIAFQNASGVTANETELRFRDVAVGIVERVSFTDTLDQVLVDVRLDKDIAPFVDQDAQFWVVRPQISTEGIEGLDTVVTGVFIEGLWDSTPGEPADSFEGLSEPPLSRDGTPGLEITLRATGEAGLTENAPIVYRGIEVGRIGRAEISEDGSTVEAEAMIFEPHDRLISDATRFWDTSGFTFKLGPGGAEIDFSSLASLISGGVTFSTVVSGGAAVDDGAVFSVFADEESAQASVSAAEAGEPLYLTAVFDENVPGLNVGNPVDLGGIRVGRVSSVNGIVDPETYGDNDVRLSATLAIQPGRLGLQDADATPEAALAYLDELVQNGLRARLVTSSILTGGLKVELFNDPTAEPAQIVTDAGPNPVIPTAEGAIADVAATAEGLFERINNLPIEGLLDSAIGALDNVSRFIGNDDLQQMPGDIRGLVGDARGLIGSEEAQALPGELTAAATELRSLMEDLNTQEAATRLLAAVDSLSEAGTALSDAAEGIPDLVAQLEELAATANTLTLDEMVTGITDLANSANAFIGSDAAQALPGSAAESLNTLNAFLTDLQSADLAGTASEALTALRDAATSVSGSVDGVPELIERIDRVAANIEEMPLAELSQELNALMANANAVIGTEAFRQLPQSVRESLAELQGLLAELRSEDIAGAAAEALASVRSAADEVSASMEGVPELIAKIDAVAAEAETLPLNELAERLSSLLASADALIGTDAARALPADLSAALGSLQQVLDELREGGVIENANQTFASAREAANSISAAAEDLPALIARAEQVLAQAQATLQGYDADTGVGRDVTRALREVEKAAEAVDALARALERNPNSVIFGR
ncbi:MlaD family protein [Pseudooceanicola sp. LIPI14-2-Ac024]|uniref:MlaD family protein n=1 Tax=Pseudooceanicola sp. LIPI14-2-Ac024 TaxID=3344875 RepID=UPI0035CEF9D3